VFHPTPSTGWHPLLASKSKTTMEVELLRTVVPPERSVSQTLRHTIHCTPEHQYHHPEQAGPVPQASKPAKWTCGIQCSRRCKHSVRGIGSEDVWVCRVSSQASAVSDAAIAVICTATNRRASDMAGCSGIDTAPAVALTGMSSGCGGTREERWSHAIAAAEDFHCRVAYACTVAAGQGRLTLPSKVKVAEKIRLD